MGDIRNFLQNQRTQYDIGQIDRSSLHENPLEQFKVWFNDAIAANVMEVNAMNLATVDKKGKPSSRIVLLKGIDEKGFVFFTNYNSRKAKDLQQNPFCALNFYWSELARQVRIEGNIQKIEEAESEEYFQSRPRLSQLGALASAQSEIIESREILEKRMAELDEKYQDKRVPRPRHWGGYIVTPERMEFWQGRANRLHDRFQYILKGERSWKIDRLAP